MQNFAGLDQKWKEFWKFSRKFWDFLIKISMENWLFSQFFTKSSLDFCIHSESVYTPLEDNTRFLQQFFWFRGGGTLRRSPPPSRRYWIIRRLEVCVPISICRNKTKTKKILEENILSLKLIRCYNVGEWNHIILVNRQEFLRNILNENICLLGRLCDKFAHIAHLHSQEFFAGNFHAIKRLSSAPRKRSGGGRPRLLTNFKIFKRIKVLKNESIFQNFKHFSCQKNPFVSKKIRKIEHILQEFLNVFEKLF